MHSSMIATTDPDTLPATPGAYLLLLRMDTSIELPPIFKGCSLPEGHYAYAGSAFGPGGIRARCRRHLIRRGVRHWHVDWLTSAAGEVSARAFPGKAECALIERLCSLPDIQVPVPGFGSSDCRRCEAHLLHFAAPEAIHRFCDQGPDGWG